MSTKDKTSIKLTKKNLEAEDFSFRFLGVPDLLDVVCRNAQTRAGHIYYMAGLGNFSLWLMPVFGNLGLKIGSYVIQNSD